LSPHIARARTAQRHAARALATLGPSHTRTRNLLTAAATAAARAWEAGHHVTDIHRRRTQQQHP